MLLFYLAMFVVKAFLISWIYQDLSGVIGLPTLNFLQVLMVMSFFAMVKVAIAGGNYASMEVFKKMTTIEKISQELGAVLVVCLFSVVYFVAKALL